MLAPAGIYFKARMHKGLSVLGFLGLGLKVSGLRVEGVIAFAICWGAILRLAQRHARKETKNPPAEPLNMTLEVRVAQALMR